VSLPTGAWSCAVQVVVQLITVGGPGAPVPAAIVTDADCVEAET
jgi:hypothetical protein